VLVPANNKNNNPLDAALLATLWFNFVLSAKICFSDRRGDNLPIEKKRLPTLVWSLYALNCGQDMPEVTLGFFSRADSIGLDADPQPRFREAGHLMGI